MSNLPDGVTYEDRNSVTADDFHKYCKEHPELRFWQALRNWSGFGFIYGHHQESPLIDDTNDLEIFLERLVDTFYIEGKDGKVAK